MVAGLSGGEPNSDVPIRPIQIKYHEEPTDRLPRRGVLGAAGARPDTSWRQENFATQPILT